MPRKSKRLRAKSGFTVPREGTSRLVVVKGGQEVDADDPIVKGREHLFVDVDARPVVEQATAAPGEQRIVKKPTCAGTTAAGDDCSKTAGEDGFCHLHSEDD